MPLVQTRGAASAQGFGEFAQVTAANYIEEVFSTYIYEGNNGTQTIANGIDLTGKGGLVWIKDRTQTWSHLLVDSARGNGNALFSNTTSASTAGYGVDLASNGFTLTSGDNISNKVRSYVSWTFREQPKFFDVVTYSGNNAAQNIAHSLGSAPGCIIVKDTSAATNWAVFHRSLGNAQWIKLNGTDAADPATDIFWNLTNPTSTVFSVGTALSVSGRTYVAYLFAHDAGGFGLTGTDNVISCGSFTSDGSNPTTINLGYEPQWVMFKFASRTSDWYMADVMRGMSNTNFSRLNANLSDAEFQSSASVIPTATGFTVGGLASGTLIYIAIRRGPMKVPTDGTKVFKPITASGDPTNVSVGFPTDLFLSNNRDGASGRYALSRLTGGPQYLTVTSSAAEQTYAGTKFDLQNLFTSAVFYGSVNTVSYMFGRAPSFMDVVCYTGTGVARTITHNLGAVPELMIVKSRSLAQNGVVYSSSTGNANYLRLFSTSSDSGETATSFWNSTTPTASVFSLGTANNVNGSAETYVAYLFATCAGVSKVGSYTGTGATQTINCGFTGGARFVLIKKSTSTAPDRDWYVWDTARGMVSGTDPSLKLNVTGAEANADNVYTVSTGFQIVSSADYVNASGVTYIFLAIA
jgi:hypothetical protein